MISAPYTERVIDLTIALGQGPFGENDIDDFIAKGDAKGLKDWELGHEISDPALLEKIHAFLKSQGSLVRR
jgi:hypothetical protein